MKFLAVSILLELDTLACLAIFLICAIIFPRSITGDNTLGIH